MIIKYKIDKERDVTKSSFRETSSVLWNLYNRFQQTEIPEDSRVLSISLSKQGDLGCIVIRQNSYTF